jgi:hypothetical protein
MEALLLAEANRIAIEGMAMGNGHDPDEPITDLASALTIIIDEHTDLDCSDLYDLLSQKLGDK